MKLEKLIKNLKQDIGIIDISIYGKDIIKYLEELNKIKHNENLLTRDDLQAIKKVLKERAKI